MAQGNKSHGDEFDNVVVAVESEENFSVGPGVQGHYKPPHREPVYHHSYNYHSSNDDWCFPTDTKVQLCDGRKVAMKDLKPGDFVQVVKKNGQVFYSPYLCMLHYEPDENATFLQIYIDGKNEPFSLTANHLLYASKNPQEILESPILAENVEDGMFVFVAEEDSGKVAPAKVQEVREIEATGYCAPLTEEGTIMADGVAASCYANFDHDFSHMAFWPLRVLYWVMSTLGFGGKGEDVAKVGIHWYAKALMRGNNFMFHVQPALAV